MPKLKVGLKIFSTNVGLVPEILEAYDQGLFHFIELYAVPGTFATTQKFYADLSIPCTIHAPHFGHGINLADKSLLEQNRAAFQDSRRFADLLAAPWIIVHGGFGGTLEELIRQGEFLQEERLVIENVPKIGVRNEECLAYSPEGVRKVMQSRGFSGFVLDIGHAIYASNALGERWDAMIAQFINLGPKGFHFADGDMASSIDIHKSLGEGDFPLKELILQFPNDSWVTLETPREPKTGLFDFYSDCEFLKSLV